MHTGQQSGQTARKSSDSGTQPVVVAFVEDSVGSLASLLLAADIAAAQQARLHVAHITPPRAWWAGAAALAVPLYLWQEADRQSAELLRDKVARLVDLTPVEWTFTRTTATGSVHHAALGLVRQLAPIAVVVGAPRRRLRAHRSLARWLIGQKNVPAVVAPA